MNSIRSLSKRLSFLRKLKKKSAFPLDLIRLDRTIRLYVELIQYHPTKSPLFVGHFSDTLVDFATELLQHLPSVFPVRDWMDLCASFEVYDVDAETLMEHLLENHLLRQRDTGSRRVFESVS